MAIVYEQVDTLAPAAFVDILHRSGLAARRPVDDLDRIGRMLAHADLIVVARDEQSGALVGVARSVTDHSYCCYLSDLAVDRAFQGQGIGRQLIEETRAAAGPESMCLLLAAPDAVPFYKAIGMPQSDVAFLYPRER